MELDSNQEKALVVFLKQRQFDILNDWEDFGCLKPLIGLIKKTRRRKKKNEKKNTKNPTPK